MSAFNCFVAAVLAILSGSVSAQAENEVQPNPGNSAAADHICTTLGFQPALVGTPMWWAATQLRLQGQNFRCYRGDAARGYSFIVSGDPGGPGETLPVLMQLLVPDSPPKARVKIEMMSKRILIDSAFTLQAAMYSVNHGELGAASGSEDISFRVAVVHALVQVDPLGGQAFYLCYVSAEAPTHVQTEKFLSLVVDLFLQSLIRLLK